MAASVIIIAAGVGCQLVLNVDPVADAGAPPWACLAAPPGAAKEERATPILVRRRYATFSQVNCQNTQPIPAMEVKACVATDTICASPVASVFSDCDGYVTIQLYRGFVGYLLLTPPRPTETGWPEGVTNCFNALAGGAGNDAEASPPCTDTDVLPVDLIGLVDMLVPPLATSDDAARLVPVAAAYPLFSRATLSGLLAVVNRELDPEAGHFLGQALDCNGAWAAGVTIDVAGVAVGDGGPSSSKLFFTDPSGSPTIDTVESSSFGDVGYVNLEWDGDSGVRPIIVSAKRRASGERIGDYAALLRRGHMTRMDMPPLAR